MALRPIMKYDTDDILRKKSKTVEKVDDKILVLLKDMTEIMYHEEGAGLAAVQVGILKRVIVIDIGEGLTQLINPEIVEMRGEQTGQEGCLSIPGIWSIVKRPQEVTVVAMNEKAEPVRIHGAGLFARALCHEIDHLDGILFIDRAEPGTAGRSGRAI